MNIVKVGLGVIVGSFAMGQKESGKNNEFGVNVKENTLIRLKV